MINPLKWLYVKNHRIIFPCKNLQAIWSSQKRVHLGGPENTGSFVPSQFSIWFFSYHKSVASKYIILKEK